MRVGLRVVSAGCCCYINRMRMRMLIMLLIFAIGFSSYVSAANAFSAKDCAGARAVMADCADHADMGIKKQASDEAMTICLDCHHCCTSHVLDVMASDFVFREHAASLYAPVVLNRTGDFLFSLLRPPRSFV